MFGDQQPLGLAEWHGSFGDERKWELGHVRRRSQAEDPAIYPVMGRTPPKLGVLDRKVMPLRCQRNHAVAGGEAWGGQHGAGHRPTTPGASHPALAIPARAQAAHCHSGVQLKPLTRVTLNKQPRLFLSWPKAWCTRVRGSEWPSSWAHSSSGNSEEKPGLLRCAHQYLLRTDTWTAGHLLGIPLERHLLTSPCKYADDLKN